MAFTIDLPPELEDNLVAEAARHGVAAQEYALRLIADQLRYTPANGSKGPPGAILSYVDAPQDEWERAFLAWVTSHQVSAPPLSDETLRREHLYDDRGL